ncbi:hypothetical protein SFRURICE_005772 [Spodoptera frugiperda]|nr:hypothetical protein SFRURICE_005772 [Spodoptera frugiperda]
MSMLITNIVRACSTKRLLDEVRLANQTVKKIKPPTHKDKPLKMEDLTKVYLSPLPDSPYVRPFRFNYVQGGKDKNWDMLAVHDSVAIIVFNTTKNVLIFVKQFRPDTFSKMENMVITDVFMTVLPDNATVRPLRFFYSLDNKMMSRDMIEVTDSVFVIVFNVTRRMMVMAKHFRPAVYFNCIPPAEREAGEIDTNKYPASLGITLEMCAGIVDKNKSLQEIAKEEVLEECGYDVPLRELHQIASYRAGVGVQGSLQTLFYCEVTDDMKVGKAQPNLKYVEKLVKTSDIMACQKPSKIIKMIQDEVNLSGAADNATGYRCSGSK